MIDNYDKWKGDNYKRVYWLNFSVASIASGIYDYEPSNKYKIKNNT